MISQIFIDRPKLSIVISVVTVLAGVLCLTQVPIAEYPEIAPPTINVSASYPGASAQVIAETVGAIIEAEVNGVEDMIYFSSTSDNSGNYSLTITFESGTNDDMAQVNVQNAVQRAEPSLPEEVKALGVTVRKRSSDILAMYSFMTDGTSLSQLELSNYIRLNVRDALARINGISEASIMGERAYSMRIWLDPLRMSSLNISPEEIISAIQTQNIQAAAGTVGAESSNDYIQLKVNTLGRLQSVDEFGDIIIKVGKKGQLTRLRDVARIELGAETYAANSTYNGKENVALAIYRNSDANALSVINAANAKLEELSQYFPDGVSYTIGYDPTEYIRITMEEIVETLIVTLLLVVGITYLFLQDWRATLIPSITIPVSLMGTFVFLIPLGFTINTLTMFALILVIGSLVDDAIVVVENCMRIIEEEHLPPKQAVEKSMQQITGAVIATTLVIVAIYAPIGFYGGMVGTIYLQFSATMCISLVISTVNALTLSPALCRLLLRPLQETRNPLFIGFNKVLNFTRNGYVSVSKLFVRRAILTILIFCGVFAATYWRYNKTQSEFLPAEDKGALMVDVQLPPGATLHRTDLAMKQFYDKVKSLPGVKDMIIVSGFSFIGGNGENVGLGIVTLKPWDQRQTPDTQIAAIQQRILKETADIASAKINVFQPPAIMGLGVTGGVSFVLQATGNQTPQELMSTLNGLLANLNNKQVMPHVMYAFSSFEASTPQLYLDIDRAKAESMNIPINRIFTTLQSKLASLYVNDFNIYGNSFQVKIQSEAKERSSLSDISQIMIRSDNGKMVPLSSIAKVSYMVGPRQIQRFNQSMSASVNAQSIPGVSSGALMKEIEQLVKEKLPKEYRISWTDMSYQERGNEGKIVGLMALALVFGYLFLVAQYESWSIPMPVMVSVMFALLGGLLGVWAWGISLSIYAQLGLIMLVGLSSKNAILMVEFSKQEREAGKSIFDAAQDGLRQRYRAVLMTAWSFIIGVYPMVIATGAGAGSRRAIGITTFSGMLLATIIGITFIPALYALVQRFREWVKHGKNC